MENTKGLLLPGLDGSNPVAFLAALGALRLLSSASEGCTPQLAWREGDGAWRPVVFDDPPLSEESVLQCLAAELDASKSVHGMLGELGDDLSVSPQHFRKFALSQVTNNAANYPVTEFLAAFGSDVTTNDKGDVIQDTAFRTMGGAGHQHFLGFMRNIAEAVETEHLRKALFAAWQYDDAVEKLTMRWDPADDSRYALQWRNPSGDPQRKKGGSMLGANRLAIEGLPLFPTAPIAGRLYTTGFRGFRSRDTYWTWPIWVRPASLDVVRSLLASKQLQELEADQSARRELASLGIASVYRVQRLTIGKVRNLSPPVSL